jgi:hypothetical protein
MAAQSAAGATRLPEIWFFLRGDPGQTRGVDTRQGWMRLSEPDAPLPKALEHVPVVVISPDIPDDILAKTVAVLNRHRIKLAMEVLAQSWVGQPKCGGNVESYTDPPGNTRIAQRIHAAGGTLTYVTMDEPLYFGHYYDGMNACHSSIENVAERAAAIIHEYCAVFPELQVGDTEPVPSLNKQPHWRSDYQQWLKAFRAATGMPIRFLNMDINWPEDSGHWDAAVQNLSAFAGQIRLPIGVIYNASIVGGAQSDEQWLDSTVKNLTRVESELKIAPAKVLFESWDAFPRRSFGDESGPGEDYLVLQYLRAHKIVIP